MNIPEWVLNICVPAAIVVLLAVGVFFVNKFRADGTQQAPKLKVRGLDLFGVVASIEHAHDKSRAKRKYGEAQTLKHVNNALEGKYNMPFFDKENIPAIAVTIAAIILVIGIIIVAAKGSGLLPSKPVIESGPMPMGEKFEVAPNKETNPDMLPIFDGGLSETKKVFECRDVVSMFVTTPGTLVIDNFTKKNIRVETPASFPGLITLECNGKIGLSQTQLLAAPTIPAPTQFSTSTSAPTQMIPSQVETQAAPVVQDPTPFPTLASNQYYSAWVKQGNTYQPGSWNFNTQEGMDLIAGKTESHACGEWVSFGQADVIAIVNTNESAPSATIEVAEDGNSVRVNCTYTTPVQYYAP